jgi:hypothetical protein
MTNTSAPLRPSTKQRTVIKRKQQVQPMQGNESLLRDALANGDATVLAMAFNVGVLIDANGATMDLQPASYAIVMLHNNPPHLHGLYGSQSPAVEEPDDVPATT